MTWSSRLLAATAFVCLTAGAAASSGEVSRPALESDDAEAHLRYASQQSRASQRAEGDASEELASQAVAHFRRPVDDSGNAC